MYTVTLQTSIQTLNFLCTEHQTISDAANIAGVNIYAECRSGFCGACRCKLLSGTITYVNDPLAYLEKSEILPCISIAKSDLVLSSI